VPSYEVSNPMNAEGGFGHWSYAVAKKVARIPELISRAKE
jgi:hypothetical protein